MAEDIIFVSHGDIILDKMYDDDYHLIGQDGGGSNWNTLYNLAYMGENCYAIGSCGQDREGEIAVDSLREVGVHTDFVVKEEKETNVMNIIIPSGAKLGDDSVMHNWYSPITNRCTMHFSENLPIVLPQELQNKKVFINLDKFEAVNFEFVQSIKNKVVCLDIGSVRFIEHFTDRYLISFFKTADLIQINQNVASYLFQKLHVKNEKEFFDLLDLNLLVITKGKKGAAFLWKENGIFYSFEKAPKKIAEVVDSSGAGDAFFSTVIRAYANTDKITSSFIETTFDLASQASVEVIGQVGSRRKNRKDEMIGCFK